MNVSHTANVDRFEDTLMTFAIIITINISISMNQCLSLPVTDLGAKELSLNPDYLHISTHLTA